MKFEDKDYFTYQRGTVLWYIGSLLLCAIIKAIILYFTFPDIVIGYIIPVPITWFIIYSVTYWICNHEAGTARYISCFAKHFMLATPDIMREEFYTYYIEMENGKKILIRRNVNMKTIEIIKSDYKPIFPKLFYTRIIMDLHKTGNHAKFKLVNNDVTEYEHVDYLDTLRKYVPA